MSTTETKGPRRRLNRLEKRLASALDTQARRTRQAARAQERSTLGGGARKLVAKRTRQLQKANRRATAIEAAIAELRAAATGPEVYCLRDRARVVMRDPHPITMRNGRVGVTGSCPTCGGRVVRPG
jgi:hypothetical protein